MRRIIAFFIRNVVLINLTILLITIFGYLSATNLTSSFFPKQKTKFIIVEAVYPGASPEEVEEGITLKIEENLQGVSGIDRVTSTSSENAANIQVELLSTADADIVLQDVKNAVDQISSFPQGMERVVVYKQEILNFTAKLALSGDVPLEDLKEKAQQVEDELRASEEISKIILTGYTPEEIEVSARENLLRSYGLTFEDLANAVRAANIEVTGGTIKGAEKDVIIRVDNKEYYAQKLEDIVVKGLPDGRLVRLRDVAEVKDKFEETTNRAFFNGKPAVLLTINTLNEEDILGAAAFVRNYIDKFNKQNQQIKATLVDDATVNLRERIGLLEKNGLIGGLLVVLLLGMFLRIRLAFWVAIGIPISFLGMIILANLAGITINVLSLFGMILVIGILVDDGIVVGENIFQHYEDGEPPLQAAVNGTLEVLPSIISALTTTSIGFAFFFFIEGQLGEYFSDVSFVVICALGVSLVEVMLFLPAHLAHSKDLDRNYTPNALKEKVANVMFWVRDNGYKPLLAFILRHKIFYFLIILSVFVITIGAVRSKVVRTVFFPNIETNSINVVLELPAGTNDTITENTIKRIAASARALNQDYRQQLSQKEDAEVKDVIEDIEITVGPTRNTASAIVYLARAENRTIRSFKIASDLREKVGPVPNARKLAYETTSAFGKPISISLSSSNYKELQLASDELKTELRDMPTVKDVVDNFQESQPEVGITLNEQAKLLGLNPLQVISQVRNGFFGQEAQRLQRGDDEVKVWVRYHLEDRGNREQLREMRIRTPDGRSLPLEQLVNIEEQQGPIAINHRDGRREIRVDADVASLEVSSVDVISNITSDVMPSILSRHPSIDYTLEGQVRETAKLGSSAALVGPPILLLMLAMLIFTFKSYSQAISLILMLPFGLIGAIWGHYIHGLPISVLSILGFVALIGILLNDGLVFTNTLNDKLRAGTKYEQALKETGLSRFRPLVLTTITTAAGLGPLIFETSFQAQFLIPMAATVAYGLVVGSFFIATLLPVFLIAANRLKVYYTYLWTGEKPEPEAVERAVKDKRNKEKYEKA
ncbi:efflux RND transporter permease subunit [Pontibacter cellulosilyticus]|uniref:Efflux RND transporter permease subunit n=1 Tax=Pontibacter cellulosilyticus TaxID=1720253 RepID=A0A923SIP5_9BACT|nr:efflux RND transporter permease subunit [Pontibacter cellulosilyticus]MBC5991886.1 efflux RND transporter permease subunit [Pontibacter cellulosilyticus]